jgi:hypothetical protein
MGAMNDLVRIPRGVTLAAGQEWWEDNPHRLADRIRRERHAGRIREVARYAVLPGRHGAIVVRLRPGPSRRRIAALWLPGAAIAGGAMAAGTWWVAVHLEEIAAALLTLALVAGGLALLVRVLSGHRPTCTGLHCPGCRH